MARRSFGALRKLPSGRFQASYIGPDTLRHVAPVTFTTKLDAEVWLGKEAQLISMDVWTSPKSRETAKHDKGLTLREVTDTYLEERDLKPRTRTDYRRLADLHILPVLGHVPVKEISESTVASWFGRLNKKTPTERARTYQLLRAVLNSAVDIKLIDVNPARIKGAGVVKRAHKVEPATLPELETIVSAMPERLQLAILLGAWCALRYGEIAELRRKDVVLANGPDGKPVSGKIRIRRGVTWPESASKPVVGTPKSTAGIRDVALPPHLLPVVAEHLKKHAQWGADGLLFPSRKGVQIHHASFHKPFRKATRAAGRDDLHVHDLRHTGAVLAASTGATLAELMARLGHSTPGAAMKYQHAAADRDAIIAAKLSDVALAAIS